MSSVLDKIPTEARNLIVSELARCEPVLLAQLREAQEPTNEQSDAVVAALSNAMGPHFGPGHIPNEYGKAIDNAIGAYLLAWPIYR